MSNFKFKIENTLKIEFNTAEKPTSVEIVNFMKENHVKLKEILGFYGSETENCFFVKFLERKELLRSLDLINSESVNMIIKGRKFNVKATFSNSFSAKVFISGLPFEVHDDEVVKKLSKYGKVNEIIWQKHKIDTDINIYKGIRIISMEITDVIPPYIHIFDVKVRAFFKHQKDMCYNCLSITHHRSSCTVQKITSTNDEFVNTEKKTEDKCYVSCNNNETKDDQQGKISNFEEDQLDNSMIDFKVVTKKVKKEKETKLKSNRVSLKIPDCLKAEQDKSITLNKNIFETEIMIVGGKEKFGYGGKNYPKGAINGRLLPKNLLQKLRQVMGNAANRKIEEVLKESKEYLVKLNWFLLGNRVYYEVV